MNNLQINITTKYKIGDVLYKSDSDGIDVLTITHIFVDGLIIGDNSDNAMKDSLSISYFCLCSKNTEVTVLTEQELSSNYFTSENDLINKILKDGSYN